MNSLIEKITAVGLPVDEELSIRKNRLMPEKSTGDEKRICIVTGTHGDELEGQYVCYLLNKRIKENMDCLSGIVDIYPALNPTGIDSITRGIPMFDLDMNRIFPGGNDGTAFEYVASQIIEDIKGADMCIDIHASNIFLREIPQIRISDSTAEMLLPYAGKLGVDFVWVHASATVLQSTLAHSLNSCQVPTLVVEMGVGMRITQSYGEQLVNGILNLMKSMGIWTGETAPVKEPIISNDGKVGFVNAEASGVFIPAAKHWTELKKGQHIGDIISPLEGTVLERVDAPCDGLLFTLREYPMVYCGSLIARILEDVKL